MMKDVNEMSFREAETVITIMLDLQRFAIEHAYEFIGKTDEFSMELFNYMIEWLDEISQCNQSLIDRMQHLNEELKASFKTR